ncbi:MAG: hypothetical protein SGI92_05590, partial [Bryobacteraceae bacterium]|nr:hypothetical protein [Bryobacteraceae bacterium]
GRNIQGAAVVAPRTIGCRFTRRQTPQQLAVRAMDVHPARYVERCRRIGRNVSEGEIFAEKPGEFFAKIVDAQFSFIEGPDGRRLP